MRSLLLTLFFVFALASACQAAPTITSPPVINGEALVGQRLVAVNTQVDEAMDIDLTISWERAVDDGGFVGIPGAHDTAYLVNAADAGCRLRVHVVVETADGKDESWSMATAPVARASDVDQHGRLRLGPARSAPAALARWVVTAGADVAVSGQLPAAQLEATATIVLESTVAGYQSVRTTMAGDESGRLSGSIVPLVNAVVWLELDNGLAAPQRIRLGVVGVRPQIRLRLAARRDGVDAQGRTLIRDLALLPGSVVAPGVASFELVIVPSAILSAVTEPLAKSTATIEPLASAIDVTAFAPKPSTVILVSAIVSYSYCLFIRQKQSTWQLLYLSLHLV